MRFGFRFGFKFGLPTGTPVGATGRATGSPRCVRRNRTGTEARPYAKSERIQTGLRHYRLRHREGNAIRTPSNPKNCNAVHG